MSMNRENHFLSTFLIALIFLLTGVSPGFAQDGSGGETLLLWPEGVPGAKGDTNLDRPTVTVFLPDKQKATGTGVVVFPGGGYAHLAMDHEGYQVADWLNELGVAAFVVKYRLGERYRYPSQLMDARRAIRIVRNNAEEWGVKADNIGILGFSAGGHLASTAATHFEMGNPESEDPLKRLSSRPDFMILIYPVITMQSDYTHKGSRYHLLGENPEPELVELMSNENQVSRQTPPAFIVHGSNDSGVPVQNSVQFYLALRKHDVPAEMHLFEDGPHGFGLAPDDPELSEWPALCERWMKSRGLLGE